MTGGRGLPNITTRGRSSRLGQRAASSAFDSCASRSYSFALLKPSLTASSNEPSDTRDPFFFSKRLASKVIVLADLERMADPCFPWERLFAYSLMIAKLSKPRDRNTHANSAANGLQWTALVRVCPRSVQINSAKLVGQNDQFGKACPLPSGLFQTDRYPDAKRGVRHHGLRVTGDGRRLPPS
jgi:hypothetical protein